MGLGHDRAVPQAMTRMLILAMHRPRRSLGQRFRFEQYLDYLQANGFNCDLSYLISEADDRVLYAPGRYDIVFIFREALMVNLGVIEAMLALRGPKIVFDFDDAVWLQPVSDANRTLAFLRGGPSKIPGDGTCPGRRDSVNFPCAASMARAANRASSLWPGTSSGCSPSSPPDIAEVRQLGRQAPRKRRYPDRLHPTPDAAATRQNHLRRSNAIPSPTGC